MVEKIACKIIDLKLHFSFHASLLLSLFFSFFFFVVVVLVRCGGRVNASEHHLVRFGDVLRMV